MLAQATENGIDPNWILLDSQSTISVFCNPNMLANVESLLLSWIYPIA